MAIRLVRPMYSKVQITNLRSTCRLCKTSFSLPGIDNDFCSEMHKQKYISFVSQRRQKRQRKKENRLRKQLKGKWKQKLKGRLGDVNVKGENGSFKQMSLAEAISKKVFYQSLEWYKLRFLVLKKYGRKCMCCYSTNNLHVDHIKPISRFPELALIFNNLQVLCKDCNLGKLNDDYTDFRHNI